MSRTFLEYSSAMVGCYAAMPEQEREALHEWEVEHVDGTGTFGTSDWPGWRKYIGRFEPQAKEKNTFGYVYLVQSSTGECKIGSSNSVERRFQQLQSANPNPLSMLHYFPSENAQQAEHKLHKVFAHKRIRNEWFSLSDSDIREIRSLGPDGAQQVAQADSPTFGESCRVGETLSN